MCLQTINFDNFFARSRSVLNVSVMCDYSSLRVDLFTSFLYLVVCIYIIMKIVLRFYSRSFGTVGVFIIIGCWASGLSIKKPTTEYLQFVQWVWLNWYVALVIGFIQGSLDGIVNLFNSFAWSLGHLTLTAQFLSFDLRYNLNEKYFHKVFHNTVNPVSLFKYL